MKSTRRFWLLLMLLITLLPCSVLASRGGTDANGGHYDHSTGLYHYHHGYPEHQHENGICPYTGEKWELNVPEKPATLDEWNAQKHSTDEKPGIDIETPENNDWETAGKVADTGKKEGSGSSALPIAAAGGAVLLAGAAAALHSRNKKNAGMPEPAEAVSSEPVHAPENQPEQTAESKPEKPAVRDMSPEAVIPVGTVIGDDGLPWEADAYAREKARVEKARVEKALTEQPADRKVATNFSEPKWGALYSFCTDADGEEIHTLTCEMAFIQINAADRNCPKVDCPVCKPVRPDLSWYAEYLKRKAEQTGKEKQA